MSIGNIIELPVLVNMALLFGGILLVYGFKAGKVEYQLLETGIRQRIRRFLPYKLSGKEQERFFQWSDVRSFKNDKDWSRRYKEYEYLKLYLTKSPRQIWITDQIDKTGFKQFKQAFLNVMETQRTDAERIQEKPGFYSTWFAKVLTIVFVVITLGLMFYWRGEEKFTHFVRLRWIMVPGTLYMVFRVFQDTRD